MTGFIADIKPYGGGRATERAACVCADNASPMTHTGTNTWIVTEPGSKSCLVVDPAPDGAHVRRIGERCAASGLSIAAIAVTHHHFDHTEGVVELAHRTGAALFAPSGEVLRRFRSGDSCGPGVLDEAEEKGILADGGNLLPADSMFRHSSGGVEGQSSVRSVLRAGAEAPFTPFEGAPKMSVIALPGHSSDSVGILLEEERTLLTGDVLFRHGPTVVFHPDGQLGPYLDSLDALEAMVREGRVERFLPAHGWPIDEPLRIIEATRAHRLERLAQIEEALARGVAPDPDALFEAVYVGVDPRLKAASVRSIEAQLAYLGYSVGAGSR